MGDSVTVEQAGWRVRLGVGTTCSLELDDSGAIMVLMTAGQ